MDCVYSMGYTARVEKFNELIDKYKVPIGLSFLGIILIIGGIYTSNLAQAKPQQTTYPKESIVSKDSLNKELIVDLSGAVSNPGVYQMGSNDRVVDLLKLAGGLNPKASKEFVAKSLNLSQKLSDGMKVYIPFEGEQGVVLAGSSSGIGSSVAGKIGINSGSEKDLDTLPGIGAVTASKIISNRPYGDVSELLSKKAVSNSVYQKIKDLVDVN